MSTRNDAAELWFCHECHAEMRPLMVPDPHCPTCNSDFVERIETTGGENDPREFMQLGDDVGPGAGGAMDLLGLLGMMLTNNTPPPAQQRRHDAGNGFRFEMRTGGAGGTRSFVLGGPNTLDHGHRGDHPPPLANFLDDAFLPGPGLDEDGRRQRQANMQNHPFGPALLALLGAHPAFGGRGNGRGQFGDYVFDQDAFDQIVTQLMEANNANRPVPAPEDLIGSLPRRKVTVNDYLESSEEVRGRECAVCKDTLLPSPESGEDGPATLVKLPCMHEFHEDCIIPWLKNSSGTCPVCRHELVNQPHHAHGPQEQAASREAPGGGGGGITDRIRNAASNVFQAIRHPGSSHETAAPAPPSPTERLPGAPPSPPPQFASPPAPSLRDLRYPSPHPERMPGASPYNPYRAPSPQRGSARTPQYSAYNPVSSYHIPSPSSPTERPGLTQTSSGGYVLGAEPRRGYFGQGRGNDGGSGSVSPARAPGSSSASHLSARPSGGSSPTSRPPVDDRQPQTYSYSMHHERYDPRGGSASERRPGSSPTRPGQQQQSRHRDQQPPGAWDELD